MCDVFGCCIFAQFVIALMQNSIEDLFALGGNTIYEWLLLMRSKVCDLASTMKGDDNVAKMSKIIFRLNCWLISI